jgi:hypothetical protein
MSDVPNIADSTPKASQPVKSRAKSAPEVPSKILLISYPKIVFLYPTFLVSFVAAVYLSFAKPPLEATNTTVVVFSVVFLGVFGLNLVILGFDFPRTSSLTLFFLAVAVATCCALLFVLKPGLLPVVTGVLRQFRPLANATFFWAFAVILATITVAAIIDARFDRWEARSNELLHREGIWGNLRRYPVLGLRIDTEMSDVFEYLLLRSGRLILRPSNEPRAIILDNVPFIDTKEQALTRLLGALEVEIRSGDNSVE